MKTSNGIKILENYDLKKLNTFGISVRAKFFVEINNETDLEELFKMEEFSAQGGSALGGKNIPKLFLGGGSNILFTENFDGIVILNKLKGIEIIKEDQEIVLIKSMGGVMWHDLVTFIVNRGYWGIENLSLIPGTVGAAPVQNIGAYGVELKDILENVETYEIKTGQKKVFEKKECKFGYRDSVFKNKLRGEYFISAITLKLNKAEKLNINYKVLQEYLEKSADAKTLADKNKIIKYTPKIISDAVISIRQSKLPDPVLIGNAGSFFKNIYVPARNAFSIADAGGDQEKFKELINKYPDMPFFKEGEIIKIPAGWLIEKCGWKGRRIGNVGVYDKQAVILVNYGGATGKEVEDLSNEIINSVKSRFGLILEREVNLI
ncbi:UDP-N-acetylenolpyruvoylglucosamine reductase [Candidatus Nomurabacteria bacterium CG_4_9_14_0_2_um_filter_32_10]|uniref:UDP-N-acetylenolpyruvoylglucosamine reductase n=3 Tax=Candidatus Nomuraibacteriota TaxID=1752729 RepID=A0A2H0CH62_9BACT|nr:MAG: UDP-N-acetylenolpyruvoylglucosamine reductase [Candidatus Nomurabacteria bacterium CG22_combo_CG10-13_8_21_14_all_32_8]PIZ85564.1 MAG: UDP-N-acetylenolpyruvoylglucosamine reductase [Candidatus Nomurabacteria bacterium CG_4_10_14_0_2_um_filter_33_9]PJC49263.1 MAG: UDP-N-acetylenolpyruvoylglucosamine reductase [Candidatus Nomurabacteria bacterium CG_4_9_14_0_2_um_filter_32_10]